MPTSFHSHVILVTYAFPNVWMWFLVCSVFVQESLENVGQTLEEFGSSVWRGYVI